MARGRRARPVFNDAALGNPRTGWILTGSALTILISTSVWVLCGLVAGMPGWAFVLALMVAVFGAAMLGAGFHETRQALDQRASMADITGSFERILADEWKDPPR